MSKTPRTDAEFKLEAFFDGAGIVETVLVEFAEQLEAELADKDRQLDEARAEIERKDALIERLRSTLACARPYVADSDSLTAKMMLDTIDAALEAAERGE